MVIINRKVFFSSEDFRARNSELGLNLPFSEDISVLGESSSVNKKNIPNRIALQAMEGCDGTSDGKPDELTKRRYARFAESDAGIIWFEATAVLPEGRANPHQLYINGSNLDSFKEIAENIRETAMKKNGHSPLLIMQITHSGRYSKPHGKPEPLIAYNNPIFEKDCPISSDRILSDEYLDSVRDALVGGTVLAEKAGFDGVDIKCCHRYLNSELLSAYTREGRYGGSLENRTRLLRESIKGVIESTNSGFIASSRVNMYDGFPYPYGFGVSRDGGLEFDPTEPEWLIRELYSYGVSVLNISMGNPYFNPHVNRPFTMGAYSPDEHPLVGVARILNGTAKLKKALPDMKIICSALSYLGVAAPNVAAAFIKDGGFDYAGFGRQAFAYPSFPHDILNDGHMDKDKCCICCSKCTEIMRAGGTPGCVIRDKSVYLPIYNKYCRGEK